MNMNKLIISVITFVLTVILGTTVFAADEQSLFANIAPNALVLLDQSGSMNWTAAGRYMYASSTQNNWHGTSFCQQDQNISDIAYYADSGSGHTQKCDICPYNTGYIPIYSNSTCSGPFYINKNHTGFTTDCSRLAIAKRSIFNLMNAESSDDTLAGQASIYSVGSNSDDLNLHINIGFMKFDGCNAQSGSPYYNSNCISMPSSIGTKYSQIFCGSSSQCLWNSFIADSYTSGISHEDATGGTPLADALYNANTTNNAKSYLDTYASTDNASTCRQNFVILISDGADTYSCHDKPSGYGLGSEDPTGVNDFPRRKAAVYSAYKLGQAGYRVFVIGFGKDLEDWQKNTLNWMGYFGNKANTTESAITPISDCDPTHTSNDPGYVAPSQNYALLASDQASLDAALAQAINAIRQGTYSFSIASISTARIPSENNLYEASFMPIPDDPFWQGHLKKYNLDSSTGAVLTPPPDNADGGKNLNGQLAASRKIKTLIGGAWTDFDASVSSISPAKLGVANAAAVTALVGYVRGDPAYNPDNWKLGDIFHSNPVVITSPSAYFEDKVDKSTPPNAFEQFRTSHQRPSGGGRVVVTGANDGQFHIFETLGMTEQFSFIPPNLLSKLQLITHATDPTYQAHNYFVDGPTSAADVWLGSGSGNPKSASEWHTIVVFGEGRGAGTQTVSGAQGTTSYLWSSSQYCDSGSDYTGAYDGTHPYYCGYYALDFTNMSGTNYVPSSLPSSFWRLTPSATDAAYIAEPWSKMAIGRVKVNGNEKWVGFIGGGGYSYACGAAIPSPTPATAGKGFFVVDLSNGNILWSYTSRNDSTMSSIPAPPSIVDTDNDGFIDTAYIGDLTGNVWRLKFCTAAQGSSCTYTDWRGGRLYQKDTNASPIYGGMSVARDSQGDLWVYWGSGDKQCPNVTTTHDRLYALMDNDRTTSYTETQLKRLSGTTFSLATDTQKGWYKDLAVGEKMVSDPLVFANITFFTTFTPYSGTNLCNTGGNGTLYGLNYITGGGSLTSGASTYNLGDGIPSSPLVSLNPNANNQADLYVTVSGGGGGGNNNSYNSSTTLIPFNPPMRSNRSNMIYWKDRRVQ